MRTPDPRQFACDLVAEHLGGGGGLHPPVLRQIHLQLLEQQVSGHRILDAREQLLENRNAVGAMPVAMPGVHALGEHPARSVPTRLPRSEVVHHTCS